MKEEILNDPKLFHLMTDEVNWDNICRSYRLTEAFINRNENKVNWFYISKHQVLSMNFIKIYKDKVNWNQITKWQGLTQEFIKEMKYYIYWDYFRNKTTYNYPDSFWKQFTGYFEKELLIER